MLRPILGFSLALFSSAVLAAQSSAQTIFEPVRYQYGGQNSFYYGGSDPAVTRNAEQPRSADGRVGRVHGFAFVSGNVLTHREVSSEPVRVFSDAIPEQNAALYGFTPDTARNEANARVATSFRMRDLLTARIRQADGSFVVPARPQGPRN